ncbi:MAG TPA: hypothetical protein VF883_15930 [Thermoanaerobaculia bacterium]|jgi:hypothetical protein
MKRALLAILLLGNVACATVVHGPMQRIRVESDPPEAIVRTELCGPGSTKETTTPATVWVSRRAERCTLTIVAPYYEEAKVILARAIAPEFYGNLELAAETIDPTAGWGYFLLGGLVAGTGFGVDAVTGALFEQQPNQVYVNLTPLDQPEP